MKVEAGNGYPYASQRAQAPVAGRNGAASFSSALASLEASNTVQADEAGITPTDFTSMTRQEMRDWVNGQIRSGAMTLDDGLPFMLMTMKIPVGGGYGGELAAESDGTRYDFMQKARDGIQGALSRHDETTLKMLESAVSIMQRQQGRPVPLAQ